ncbi:MAG: DUF503 domain-containing protein [bacterium]|nr:DUF503 domain-containing protein [bacterium]
MVVGVSVFELHLPGSRSLKQKRKVVKGLVDRIHRRFRVSIAETGHQDLHQRAEISIAAVARSPSEGQRLMDSIRDLIDTEAEAMLTYWQPEMLEELR